MVNISLTLYTKGFFGSFLKSPTQMGSLSIKNSVTNISRLGTFKRRKTTACWSVKDWMNETERRNSMSQFMGRRDRTRQSKEGSALDRIVKKKLSIGGWTWDDLIKRNTKRHADKGINSKMHEEKEETAKDMQRQGETTRDIQRKEETARDM
jgi:hypothetical protein